MTKTEAEIRESRRKRQESHKRRSKGVPLRSASVDVLPPKSDKEPRWSEILQAELEIIRKVTRQQKIPWDVKARTVLRPLQEIWSELRKIQETDEIRAMLEEVRGLKREFELRGKMN